LILILHSFANITKHNKYNIIIDPEYSDSDSDDDQQPETISAKGVGKGGKKRKGHSTNKNKDTSINNNQENDDSNEPSTVIYLGHLPQGFEEREITVFLNQFGNVSKCEYSLCLLYMSYPTTLLSNNSLFAFQ